MKLDASAEAAGIEADMKLPVSIKHLLTLRNPHPKPSPPVERLHGIFTQTLREATRHHARDGWLVLTTSTLLSANVPSAIGLLYHYISRSDPGSIDDTSLLATAERTAQASLMREAALKSAIFVGVPRTILSLEALTGALQDDVKASLRKTSMRQVDFHRVADVSNIDVIQQRGRDLWKDIYAPHDVKLANKLASYHPDFISFIIQSYGSVLSPWTSSDPAYEPRNVNRTLTSVVGTACLRTEGGVGPQLVSHVFGLLKAQGREYAGEPATEGDKWLSSCEGVEWVIKTVDEICDVVRSNPEVQSKL